MESSPNVAPSAIACIPGPADENARRQALLAQLRGRMVKAAAAKGGGVTVTFTPQPGLLAELGEFLELERRCCPFLTITTTVQADGGAIEVHVVGPEEAEEMIREELVPGGEIDVAASNVTKRSAFSPPAKPPAKGGRGWFIAGGAGIASAVLVGVCCVLPALGAGGAALAATLPGDGVLDGVTGILLAVSVLSLGVGLFMRHRRKNADCGC
jgi:hypothetical protein